MRHVFRICEREWLDILEGLQTCIMKRLGKRIAVDDHLHLCHNESGDSISAIVICVLSGDYYNSRGLKKGYSIINFKITHVL